MNKYFLTFKDAKVEAHYQSYRQEDTRKLQFLLFLQAYFIVFCTRCIIYFLKEQYRLLYANLSMLTFIMINGCLAKTTHVSFRLFAIINNQVLTIFFLVFDDISDPGVAYLKGLNSMAQNFFMVMTNEFSESVFQIFILAIIRIVYYNLTSSESDYSPVVSLIVCSLFWIYYLYCHHKAMRSQFLLTTIDSCWEKIFKQLISTQTYALLHFDEETLQYQQYLSNSCEQSFHSSEQMLSFFTEAKYQTVSLKDYIYKQIQQYSKIGLDVFNLQLQVQYQRKLLIIQFSIFFGNKPTILMVFPHSNESAIISSEKDNNYLQFLIKLLEKLKNKFYHEQSYIKLVRKFKVIQILEHLQCHNIIVEKIDVGNLTTEVISSFPSLRIEIFADEIFEIFTIKDILMLFCYIVLQCSIILKSKRLFLYNQAIKIFIYQSKSKRLKIKFQGRFKYQKISQIIQKFSFHFYRIFQHIFLNDECIYVLILKVLKLFVMMKFQCPSSFLCDNIFIYYFQIFSRLMQSRTYFNLDQKQLFRAPIISKKEQEIKQKIIPPKRIIEEPQKQLWDIDIKECVTKCSDTIGNKKKKDSFFFKPGGSFIKEKTDEQKEKTEREINKEIYQVIKQTKNQFFNELREEKQKREEAQQQENLKEHDKENNGSDNQQNQNAQPEKIVEECQQVDNTEKENIENNAIKEDDGLLKKPIGKYKNKGTGNYVRLDLKKQYQDKFRGALYMNQRRYKKNGTLKHLPKTKKEQNQIDFQLLNNQGQSASYNIFIQSVSSGLLVNLFDSDEKAEQGEEKENKIKEFVMIIRENLDDKVSYLQLLKLAFGYEDFREGQFEAIQSILKRESILLVQKTGHGKSLVYQYLSLFLLESIGIIFSPLISLMIDQISKLPDTIKGIAYHSMLTSFQKDKLQQYIKDKQVQLVYCTPEIFQSDLGFCLQSFGKISFICIDEAHCVSELSHSFRHTYIILDQMVKNFLKDDLPPYLALTATATQMTVQSIMSKFQIGKSIVSIDTERKNIEITVSRDRDVNTALIKLLQSQKYSSLSSIIIYCRSRYMVDVISNFLRNSNLSCQGFHGALTEQEKMDIQSKFIKNQTKIIVATSIFAMGIDKQDIRAIIHLNLPKSVEAYIQEIGRAGRDGQQAHAHLFLREADFHLERSFILADNPDFIVLSNIVERIKLKQESDKITYFIAKFAEENFDTRKDTIYTLMQILEKCSNGSLQVFPICHEKIVLKFFKNLNEDVKQKSGFLQELIKLGKQISGNLQVNVIKACNALQMQPLEVIRQARNLFTEFYIKTEVQEEILPFQILKPLESDILEKANEVLQMHKSVALDKLNLIYIISYENSVPNIDFLLKQQQKTIREQKIFDLYFQSANPVQAIVEQFYGDTNIIINEYLPFDALDGEKEKQIHQALKRFISEETSNKTNAEAKKQTNFYLKNPKILARLFCGIQSIKYSYKEYKCASIWNKSGRLRYEDVHQVVLRICLSLLQQ